MQVCPQQFYTDEMYAMRLSTCAACALRSRPDIEHCRLDIFVADVPLRSGRFVEVIRNVTTACYDEVACRFYGLKIAMITGMWVSRAHSNCVDGTVTAWRTILKSRPRAPLSGAAIFTALPLRSEQSQISVMRTGYSPTLSVDTIRAPPRVLQRDVCVCSPSYRVVSSLVAVRGRSRAVAILRRHRSGGSVPS